MPGMQSKKLIFNSIMIITIIIIIIIIIMAGMTFFTWLATS